MVFNIVIDPKTYAFHIYTTWHYFSQDIEQHEKKKKKHEYG